MAIISVFTAPDPSKIIPSPRPFSLNPLYYDVRCLSDKNFCEIVIIDAFL